MQQMDETARRRAYLEQMMESLPPSQEWIDWQERTGELPPDFAALPSQPRLPDVLLSKQGDSTTVITNQAEWQARRAELQALFRYWLLGTSPQAPDNLQANVIDEHHAPGVTVREVELRFGPEHKARLGLELLIPEGEGPFPVFLTQHNHRGWAAIAVARGYLACVYAGSDSADHTDSFLEAYPEYDWSRLMRRAWAASRCVDYLATIAQADMQRIALTGHSRNGKLSLIASAMDERIGLVISSSSGAGGSMPARYCAEPEFGESIEALTRVFPDWFHPRLRFFSGREDRLPVDMHELVALTAPRPCLLSIAINDGVELTWAMQQTYQAVRRVYELFGVKERLQILWRPGGHETWPAIIQRYLDWCDLQFGLSSADFPEWLLHPDNWTAWQKRSGEQIGIAASPEQNLDDLAVPEGNSAAASLQNWHARREQIRQQISWMLGVAPPLAGSPAGSYGAEAPHIALLLGHTTRDEDIEKLQISFGDYISGDIYLPAGASENGESLPAVLWLHPFSYARGYAAAYKRGDDFFRALARQGFAVFCYDQIGFGRRVDEAEHFYTRYPGWSLLGKMVTDAQAALDALRTLPFIDHDRLQLAGYSLGSLVGIHLAALDERIARSVFVSAPQPFRLDSEHNSTGGISRWSHLHMLLPRLGFFVGQERRVPYDVHSLLACIAPRPVLVVSPRHDRHTNADDMHRAVEAARAVYALYSAEPNLSQTFPNTFNQFGPEIQHPVIAYLKQQ